MAPTIRSRSTPRPNGNQIYFAFGKTEITSRLIEGQFPDYQRIIPPDAKTKVKLSTTDFLRATRAAAVFARDNSNIVRLECSPSQRRRRAGPRLGPGQKHQRRDGRQRRQPGRQPSKATTPRSPSTAATCATLWKPSTPPKCCLQITGPSSPGIIRPSGEPNGYLHVIMPMHVAR